MSSTRQMAQTGAGRRVAFFGPRDETNQSVVKKTTDDESAN